MSCFAWPSRAAGDPAGSWRCTTSPWTC